MQLARAARIAVLGAALLLAGAAGHAVDLTGRVSLLGSASNPSAGDSGNASGVNTLTAAQGAARLMADDFSDSSEWSAHGIVGYQQLRGVPPPGLFSSELFRWRPLSGTQVNTDGPSSTVRVWEIDRAYYKWRFDQSSLSVGRQPVDWGTGRFWQPLNVFGAFAPTALDTDFKPGIDAIVGDWYPSVFSSLTGVYAFAPRDAPPGTASITNSGALHYRGPVGEGTQLSLVAGQVIGDTQGGAALEGDWRGIGWRIEGLVSKLKDSGETELFWIAGVDYQFDDGTLVTVELYDNTRGAVTEADLIGAPTDLRRRYGLQQQFGRHLLGVGLQKELTPLLSLNYTLLGAALKDDQGRLQPSLLNQLNLIYSLANESDLLLSVAVGSGKGLAAGGSPRSEFGHLPPTLTLRWRYFF